ncbi:MAG TPA: SLC13 family permease [Stellaceae bacterium]|nr:SLC13 family permease [Stellaceae bacterium]
MTRDQILTFAILGGMIVLFLSNRVRFDLVGLLGLLAAVLAGIVPADKAFSGFANPVLPLIGAALVVSAAIGQSGAIEILLRWMNPVLRIKGLQVGLLVACVTILSAFMKNVGALAIFLPAAIQVARRSDRSPSEFMMPLAFASLIGGSSTLIGTSPNLLISSVRQNLEGQPFAMFDFMPVGAGIAIAGVVFLAFGWRLIPQRRGSQGGDVAFKVEDYTSELRVGPNSGYEGRSVGEIEEISGGAITITAVIRANTGRRVPSRHWRLEREDIVVVEAEPQAIEQLARDGNLEVVGSEIAPTPQAVAAPAKDEDDKDKDRDNDKDDDTAEKPAKHEPRPAALEVAEAVITPGSPLIGRSAVELHLRELYGVNVLAVSRRGKRDRSRLRRLRFQLGDVVVFQGYPDSIYDTLAALGCLPLAERQLKLGRPRRLTLALIILGIAMLVSGFELVPVAIAFVAAALAIALLHLVTLDEAYEAIEWPILVMIGAMIPVGESVSKTGTAELVATGLAHLADILPSYGMLGMILVTTMLITPLLHHAPAVLVMGPIAASLAQKLGYHVDPFLMAVAIGAGSDFLSPVGHQSNTLVMGPGGYRFSDYWHLGLPMSFLVVALGVPLILIFWPLH